MTVSNRVIMSVMWADRSVCWIALALIWALTNACGGRAGSGSPAQPGGANPESTPEATVADCDFSAYRPLEGTWEGRLVRQRATPIYPTQARAKGVSGPVMVKVLVDASGTPVKACAVSGHTLLRSASEEAALRFLFKPLLLNNRPVPFVVHKLTFTYRIEAPGGPRK